MGKKILFIDETGDHDLVNIDRKYPIFGLLGIIFDYDYYMSNVQHEADSLKINFLGTSDVILHTLEIVRSKNSFVFCDDPNRRVPFYKAIDALLDKLDYTILFAVINKKDYVRAYTNRFDTYILTLEFIVERFYLYLKDLSYKGINAAGEIIAESRDDKLDKLINNEYNRILINGTDYIKPSEIQGKIKNFEINKKKENVVGLQVADLVANQLGRSHLGLQRYWGFNLENKIRKGPSGKASGYGIKIFP
jgi:hypothetical protein